MAFPKSMLTLCYSVRDFRLKSRLRRDRRWRNGTTGDVRCNAGVAHILLDLLLRAHLAGSRQLHRRDVEQDLCICLSNYAGDIRSLQREGALTVKLKGTRIAL